MSGKNNQNVTIAEMQKDIHYLKKTVSNLDDKIDDFIQESKKNREEAQKKRKHMDEQLREDIDENYAAKWAEKVIAGLVGAVLLAFIGGLIQLLGL